MTDDLRAVRVYFSALGDPKEEPRSRTRRRWPEHARGFIRTELGHRLKVRFVRRFSSRATNRHPGLHMDRSA